MKINKLLFVGLSSILLFSYVMNNLVHLMIL